MNTKTAILAGSLLCNMVQPVAANTIFLVRHAEKQLSGADPALTDCGRARAQALAESFAGVRLAAVYTTPFQRTQQTAAAVAHSQQLKLELYDPRQPELLLQQLREQQQPVLIVGHSNTLPQLVTLLTGFAMAPIDEQDYTMLYQLHTGDNVSVTLTRQSFSCNI